MSIESTENVVETWECTTGGTVWVQIKDPRAIGGWKNQKVGGKGNRRLRITPEEREFNMELVPDDNAHQNPFTNGLLVRIDKGAARAGNELSDEELTESLKLTDEELFAQWLHSINSEVVARRLMGLAEKHTSIARFQQIQMYVDSHWRVGKASRVVAEMEQDDRRYADADR